MNRILALVLSIGVVLSAAACGSTAAPVSSTSPASSAPASSAPASETQAASAPASEAAASSAPSAEAAAAPAGKRSFTDSVGRTVEIDAEITKIAVSGPLAQMVVFALAPDKMVGFANEPDELQQKYLAQEYLDLPLMGQLYGSKSGEINLEELLNAAPQVVIDVGEPKGSIAEDMDALMEQTSIPFVHISASFDTMPAAYALLGELLGKPEEAKVLSDYCEEMITLNKTMQEKLAEQKVNFLYCLGEQGLNVIAKGSYHAELMDQVGNNMAEVAEPSSKGTGNEVDMEQLLLWNPDVIVFAPDSVYDAVGTDDAWKSLKAIAAGSYYKAPQGPYNWMGFPPSIQRYLGMLWMYNTFYPQQVTFDLQQEVKRHYQLFYHYDLTDAEYTELVGS